MDNIKKRILLEDIDFNKLLNRNPINYNNNDMIKKYFINSKILITGGCGSIGSEIVFQLINCGINSIIIFDNNETGLFHLRNEIRDTYNIGISSDSIKLIIGNIRDKKRLNDIFLENKIDFVFHAAAYKHVPLMELNPYESIKTNIIGTKNVADISLKYNINKFIMVSTDKAVNPTNIMGASKRISEIYINYLNKYNKTKFITTRFGNVLGSNGSVIPTFLNKINKGKNLILTHKDITRYFMTIPEASKLVLEAAIIGNAGEILLFDMGDPIKIYDLAERMILLYGSEDNKIEIGYLREGEKLFEELLCKGENVIPTTNKKIMKLKHDDKINYNLFFLIFKKIINFEYSNDKELKKYFTKLVPDYVPYIIKYNKVKK
jgi:FlaA1/EpsC-like NDP-sugar epimerase